MPAHPRRPHPQSQVKERPIAFNDNGEVILPDTAAILDPIVVVVRDRPEIGEIQITGYAEAYERDPRALAVARGEAVRRYLIKRGIPARQLRLTGGDGDTGQSRRRVDVGIAVGR